jgi:cyanate permease
MLAAILGGAAGPWLTGVLADATGTYSAAFWIAAGDVTPISHPAITRVRG